MKRFLHILIFIIGITGISFILKDALKDKKYSEVVVQFFPFRDRPVIKLEIEGKKYSCLIDTGSSHPLILQKNCIEKIKQKKSLDLRNSIGFRGKSYPTQSFEFPDVKMPNLVISGMIGFEENLDFIKDSSLSSADTWWIRFKDELELWAAQGRIGWRIFEIGCPLFDFANMNLCFAENQSVLIKEAGYSLNTFTPVPFELVDCGVVVTAGTGVGIKRFLLDTGATHSLLRKDGNELQSITTGITIGNQDFGFWKFRLLDFADLFQCDGILGVDFFLEHKICLDFQTKTAYIKRNEPLFKRLFGSPSS